MEATVASSMFPLPSADACSDAELMSAVRQGDREAFGELVLRHKDALVGYLARLAGCRERAEDLAQDTFLRLLRSVPKYREQGQFTAYLYRIATNLLRSEERHARLVRRFTLAASPREGEVESVADPAPKGPERVLERERQERLARAVARLPIRYRVPLVLHEIEDWPVADIAALLGVKPGTVKSRLFRARKRLRDELEPWMKELLP